LHGLTDSPHDFVVRERRGPPLARADRLRFADPTCPLRRASFESGAFPALLAWTRPGGSESTAGSRARHPGVRLL